MRTIFLLWICLITPAALHAQQAIISQPSVDRRERIIRQMPVPSEKMRAVEFARQFGIPVREVEPSGRIREIMGINRNNHPLYNETHNLDAAVTVSTRKVWNGILPGEELRGNNILVGLWDGGLIRTTHVEFGSRAYSLDSGLGIDGHPTHVAGTIGAAGIDPDAIGMASHCIIEGYDWNNDGDEMRQAAMDGLLISNHSYGAIQGWDYNSSESRWEWYGDIRIDEDEDYQFGFYGTVARSWDEIAYDNPHYLIVKSAGNDRLEGPSPGTEHYYWDSGWKVSTDTRDKDGGTDGYDCMGTYATAKNILTVGAVRDIDRGYQVPGDVSVTSFSAFGPTDDGRIKPDIVGNGAALYSAYADSDTDYESITGTSMSAANLSGSLALLQELYYREHQRYMRSSMLKGVVLHTADEAGNPGPDYIFGWGLLNTYKAARLIVNEANFLHDDSISDQTYLDYRFFAPGDSSARFTICWTDPRGPILLPSLDNPERVLVNDLDIRLISLEDSTIYEPFILDPANPAAPAQKGDNQVDNIEQIHVAALPGGYYDLVVTHKGDLTRTIQHFSLIADGVQKVYVAEDSTHLTGHNGYLQVTNAPDYPLNKRFVWLIEPDNQEPVSLYFKDFLTAAGDFVTIYDGPGTSYPVLAQYSGTLPDPDIMITSSGGSMFVEFITGLQEGFPGFSATYCTTAPDETISFEGVVHPCFQAEETYTFSGLPQSEYLWTLSENIAGTASFGTQSVQIQVPADPFTLTVTPVNRCGAGDPSDQLFVPAINIPVISQGIVGDTLPCTNGVSLYTVGLDPAASYRWILPEGWTGSSDSASIRITPLKGSGILRVTPWNSCGEAEMLEISLNPVSPPAAPAIESDRASPCTNTIQEFSIVPEALASYKWEVPPGWQINGSDTLSHVSVLVGGGTSGTVKLLSSNKCGDTLSSRLFLLSPTPESPLLQASSTSFEGLEEVQIVNAFKYVEIRWYRNDSLIADFEDKSLILQRNGTYRVEGANSQGCWASTTLDGQITVNDLALSYYVSTASGGILQVENDTPGEATLRVYDLTGRMVFSGDLLPGTNRFITTRRGLAILRIEGSSYQKSQMILLY